MPTNVRRFVWLWWFANLIGAASIPLTPPDSLLLDLGVVQSTQMELMTGVMLIGLLTMLPFLWLAAWRRRNSARWVLLFAFVTSIPFLFLEPVRWNQVPLIGVELAANLVEAVAFYFLFTGDARVWFNRSESIARTGHGAARPLPGLP